MSNIIIPAGGDDGYQIQRSVRLRSSASGYFNRTPASAGNRKTWTWAGWVKRGALGSTQHLFQSGYSTNPWFLFEFEADNTIQVSFTAGTSGGSYTSAVYRDPSAWYHIVLKVDTTQATAANRVVLYVNGVQQTFGTTNYPAQNFDTQVNNTLLHTIGAYASLGGYYLDGYLTDINFIDGQALTPASFGEINPVTGVWSAKKYAGTYGTNGFFLNFSDNSAATATTIGKDSSGNGNNWTPNNISVTAGVTYDSMLDVPLGAGGPERGNYAVMNPVDQISTTVTNGNLQAVSSAGDTPTIRGTIGVSSGKYYWEVLYSAGTNNASHIGVADALATISTTNSIGANSWNYSGFNGSKWNNGTSTAYGASYTTGDVIGVALDMDAGTLTFYKNNTSQGTAFTGLTGKTLTANLGNGTGGGTQTYQANFGQRPFAYTPPTGFKALHTGNLPEPVIKQGAQYMAASLYQGTSATNNVSNAVNGVSMQPDFVWIKARTAADNHGLFDSVRGANNRLISNLTNADVTLTDTLMSFNSNGFTLGVDAGGRVNASTETYVAWQWKANGAAVSNTAGSITSQVSAGVSQGFSVVTYTGTQTAATVGHGLGVAPKMIIVKARSNGTFNWTTWHGTFTGNGYIYIDGTNAVGSSSGPWNGTLPTSSVFSLGADLGTNRSADTYVAYCFSEVAGYSKFGSYTGNGSADGPFVFTGFRPRWVLVKATGGAYHWWIWDTARNTYNAMNDALVPDLSVAEQSPLPIDCLANGFKLRTSNGEMNNSGTTYIFAAFAEHPFKNSLAR